MRKQRISEKLRGFAKSYLSPTADDRGFVAEVYAAVCDVIGPANALQIGSYPRYTAIRPLHDLDVLYVLDAWNPYDHDPTEALAELERRLKSDFKNPTKYHYRISLQTHSVTIKFFDGEDEFFAVDVVPSYTHGTNEYGDAMYVVPEIARASSSEKRRIREEVENGIREMTWIRSDPRGYITAARHLNDANADFRKAVKIAKGWRAACKRRDDAFPMKSFHLEQAITRYAIAHPNADIFDMVFAFFRAVPDLIRYPSIPDRADPSKKIDAYVEKLTETERRKVIEARDGFLIALEAITEQTDIATLLDASKRKRVSATEAYLFDQGIPVFTETDFTIVATALEQMGGFRRMVLDFIGNIRAGRKVQFRLGHDAPNADLYKWKVKNADDAKEPRGEINDHQTRHDPENTRYKGRHHVECYAIRNGVCIGRSRQNVVLDLAWTE